MDPVIECSLGTLRGKIETVCGVSVESFLGLRYGKAPVGKLRFALPEPYGELGVFDASKFGPCCLQFNVIPGEVREMSEDCLFLNVYRKQGTLNHDKKAVIVIIHGGAFSLGAASDLSYHGEPLAGLGDVITVSINYRLGVLGFTDMLEYAPGNLGLHDQRMALQWVQKYISGFGGDPNNVTVMGVSAGAMCVNALIMSPLLREEGLFHAAIMDAGVILGLAETSEKSYERIKNLAKSLGCEAEGHELLEFLREIDAEKLVAASHDVEEHSPILTFIPTMDGVFNAKDVLEDCKKNADKFIKVRTIIGCSKDEGTMFAGYYLDGRAQPALSTNEEFLKWCELLVRGYHIPLDLKDEKQQKNVIETYYKKHPHPLLDAAEVIGDGLFLASTNAFVKCYGNVTEDLYVYHFERLLKGTYERLDAKILGAFHYAPYLHFSGALLGEANKSPVEPEDEEYFRSCVEMISNFAKGSGPPVFRGLQWPDFSKGEGVLVFKKESEVVASLPRDEECKKIYPLFD